MRQIDFYFDIISPFAHVALARFGELPADVEVKPKPILLGPLLAHWGQRGPAEIAPKRLHTYRVSCFLGEKYGLAMRFPQRHPFNPLAAMRLLAGADADLATVRKAFDFVFSDGRAPDNESDLAAFAACTGVDPALAGKQNAKDRLRALTDEAIARGVFGVPTFAVDDELFWGVDAFDMLLAWLEEPEIFTRAPYAGLDQIETGIVRKAATG
ncbi:2-hydroxychromene-2-carboxylate isomerase [Neoaquamicrobium sediminum]|uniref:2-hydroxychromene-2-carboxylate isomerase n=1 Tax=Neoaquamicrobium sediminum TaxID=1849104 RepID=UPI0015652F79|nr:2-hydroxychromene-2-carboxylate isomerase [Mesorhizobium sediminum]NRC53588.1 2-hydroxychromene-2-carboxylate isomerase [Mesorhizobium sediminum]